jgi:type IV pilus biogenesis protein CpaD/CtpE
MRGCRSTVLLAPLLLALGGCASTDPAAKTASAERNCTTQKVTGSRIPKRVCEGDVDPTLKVVPGSAIGSAENSSRPGGN